MQDAALPVIQIIEQGSDHPLNLYADDDAAHIIKWILLNRALFGLRPCYQVVIDVGKDDVTGKVDLNLVKMKKAA